MATTVSLHNGSKISKQHNVRNRKITDKEKHIKKDFITYAGEKIPAENITLKHESIKSSYKKLFDKALDEYNQNKRKSRQIKDYYEYIRNDSKKHLAYECIISIGNISELETQLPYTQVKKLLLDYANSFQKRNSNLYVNGMYYHADEEGVPHLHIDYIPFYEKTAKELGLPIQTGLNKALERMGFKFKPKTENETYKTQQMLWQEREADYLKNKVKELGYDIKEPCKGLNVKHLSTIQFKEIQNQLKALAKNAKTVSLILEKIKTIKDKNVLNAYKNKLIRDKDKLKQNEKDSYELILNTLDSRITSIKADEATKRLLDEFANNNQFQKEMLLYRLGAKANKHKMTLDEYIDMLSKNSNIKDDIEV